MRLIDADALFTEFENAKWYDNNDRDLVAEDILMDAPTIEACIVVRCKDCILNKDIRCAMSYYCDDRQRHFWLCEPNDFCSKGVRT